MIKKTLSGKVFKGSVVSITDQAVVSLSNFLVGVLVAKSVSPGEFGVYSIMYAILMTLGGVQNSLIIGPLRIYGIDNENNADKFFYSQVTLQVYLSYFLALLVFIVFFYYYQNNILSNIGLCSTLIVYQLMETIRVVNITKLKVISLLKMDIITHLFRLCVLSYLFIYDLMTARLAITAIGISSIFILIKFFYKYRKTSVSHNYLIIRIRENFKFGRWLLAENFVVILSTQIHTYATAFWIDIRAAGVLSAYWALFNVANVLISGLINYAIPIARKKLLSVGYISWRKWILTVLFVVIFGTSIMGITLCIFSEIIIRLIYTEYFVQYSYLFPIMAITIILRGINTLINAAFKTVNAPKYGFKANIVSAILTVCTIYPLLTEFGLLGAALAGLLTHVVWFLVYMIFIFKGNLNESTVNKLI